MPEIADPLLKAKYVGFVAVAAVTVYELAIKEIFIEFARKRHRVFGDFTESYFERINGRIKLDEIKGEYIRRFGSEYKREFQSRLKERAEKYFQDNHRDIVISYG